MNELEACVGKGAWMGASTILQAHDLPALVSSEGCSAAQALLHGFAEQDATGCLPHAALSLGNLGTSWLQAAWTSF